MSHFILLRQRIKVVETIKKTTSAMRLISMSIHTRLRHQKETLEAYVAAIRTVEQEIPLQRTVGQPEPLIILIGSQKGLCGTFNEHLFTYLHRNHPLTSRSKVITIGKYASDYTKQQGITPISSYDKLSPSQFVAIARQVTAHLVQVTETTAHMYSNHPVSFFLQKPEVTIVDIGQQIAAQSQDSQTTYIRHLALQATILHHIYESLLAEQAARFVAMDTAYHNADKVLEQTKLDYNKTRQAYVTRELIELASSMSGEQG